MREVDSGRAPPDSAFVEAMAECVQCRGCEAACPSGVPFGRLIEQTQIAIAQSATSTGNGRTGGRIRRRVRRVVETIAFHGALRRPRVLRLATWMLVVARRLHLLPGRYASALPVLTRAELRVRLDIPAGGAPDAWLFTGCVMDAWMRSTHVAAARVLRAIGVEPARPGAGGSCCGALALHAGRDDLARDAARSVIASMPGDAPILVDSAGCGAMLRDYGHLVGTADAERFSARVHDIADWLSKRALPPTRVDGSTVVVQDPCHLRHVQRSHQGVRTILEPVYSLRETADDGLCCGAGGAYRALQPELSTAILDRKAAALRAAGARAGVVVCSANPGCIVQLRSAGFDVRHPIELLAAALVEAPAT